jgi:hypothetical protein
VNVYPFIAAEQVGKHNAKRACELLEVSRSAYYQRKSGRTSVRKRVDAQLTVRISAAHAVSKGTYGVPRIHADSSTSKAAQHPPPTLQPRLPKPRRLRKQLHQRPATTRPQDSLRITTSTVSVESGQAHAISQWGGRPTLGGGDRAVGRPGRLLMCDA